MFGGGGAFVYRQVLGFARVFFLFSIALFLPKLFFVKLHSTCSDTFAGCTTTFRLGVENLSPDFLKSVGVHNKKIGLVTNQTGKDQAGTRTIDILLKKGLTVSVIFSPEHGINGDVVALRDVENSKDIKNNIKIISLYRNGTTTGFSPDVLKDVDLLFFDMQDSGMRHYTYITTLFKMLEAAAAQNKTAIVLDRPNLLGSYMEGPLVSPKLKSAISYASIPIRYGMTIGELATYYNKKIMKKPAKLHVVRMKNYNRTTYAAGGLLAHLSPNITSMNSCYGYSFLGLLGEVRPFDLGVGTSRAFQCILLPESIKFSKKKWHELHLKLKECGVENSFYRYYSTRKKQYCSGLRLSVDNINAVSSFSVFLRVVQFFRQSGLQLTFSDHFDKAAGHPDVKKFLQGNLSKQKLVQTINRDLHSFFSCAQKAQSFLYKPFPKIINLS